MIDVTKVKSQLLYLIKKANDKTEKNDVDLTAAVETLVNGYYDLIIADGVKLSPEHSDTEKLYATGYNWFADLVALTQRMSGVKDDLTIDEILYWLGRVKYTPQAYATSNSTFMLNFETTAILTTEGN